MPKEIVGPEGKEAVLPKRIKNPKVQMMEFRCPDDGTLILRYSSSTVGVLEGKCKLCKQLRMLQIVNDTIKF